MEHKDEWDPNDRGPEGNAFWNVVQDAINSGNYQQLNRQVQDTINDTVDGIRRGMEDMGHTVYRGGSSQIRREVNHMKTEWQAAWRESGEKSRVRYTQRGASPTGNRSYAAEEQRKKQLPALYSRNPSGHVAGPLMSILGYGFGGVLTFATAVSAIAIGIVTPSLLLPGVGIPGAFALAGLAVGAAGTKLWNRSRRFRKYVRLIGDRAYCSIEELAQGIGRSPKAVVKDLRSMIDQKMFLQGHLDRQETCLIVTDAMYQQYLLTENQAEEQKRQQQLASERKAQLPEESQKILEEGKAYIRFIQECNEDIPGVEISNKLYRLETIITRIFAEVEKNPGLAGDLRKFMNYYLPTTKKLMEAYREMDKETITGSNIENTKKEIEDTLDTINQAFENLLNSFFAEKALDISSDISVLQTMLAQEGLTKKDFQE